MCEVVSLKFWLCPNILALSTRNFLSLEGACHPLPPESLSNLTAVFRAKFPPFPMGPFILISFLNHSPPQIPLLPRARFYCSQQFLFYLISQGWNPLQLLTCHLWTPEHTQGPTWKLTSAFLHQVGQEQCNSVTYTE